MTTIYHSSETISRIDNGDLSLANLNKIAQNELDLNVEQMTRQQIPSTSTYFSIDGIEVKFRTVQTNPGIFQCQIDIAAIDCDGYVS